jgi:hypothetical protein
MKNFVRFSLLFIYMTLVFLNHDAYAYPTYIRIGYNSCIGCHYNPAGGGMLTPYGKGISSVQSLKSSELSDTEEEKLSTQKYHQAFQERVLDYKSQGVNKFMFMQTEYLGRYEFNSKWKTNFTVAVAPKPDNIPSGEKNTTYQRTYARVAEINYNHDTQHLYFAGISPLPIGLGLIDHTDFVRANNRLQVTDIPINFRAFNFSEKYNFNYFAYIPHYLEPQENKEKGLGGQYWYSLTNNISLGTQGLIGTSQSIKRKLGGFLAKGGMKEFSYLGELDYTHRTIKADNNQFGQWTYYNQFTYQTNEWFNIAYAFQGLKKDRDFSSAETRHSLMLQAKLLRSLTLLYETRLSHFNSTNDISHLMQIFFQWW